MSAEVKVCLVGAGFIGGSHGLAVNAVNRVFADLPVTAVPAVLADSDAALARAKAAQYGFADWTGDWRAGVDGCDAVIIAAPSFVHKDIALYAAAHGKHVLCEKPVGLSSGDAVEIAAAARDAGVSNAVGFTYMRAPLVRHARAVLDSGVLGAPLHFRGHHCEDYLADPAAPFGWRLDASLAGRCGALGDLGWHILAIARYLCGPVTSVSGAVRTFHGERRDGSGTARTVENEDWAGLTVAFASGAAGMIEVSRIAHGRKMDIGFELVCETGTLAFHGERFNELRLYVHEGAAATAGFKTIHVNAEHPDYAAFIPAPAHGNSFNDLKTIELRDFLVAIAEGRNAPPDLDEACKIARICEATIASAERGAVIEAPEGGA